jgi:hypothetical protein
MKKGKQKKQKSDCLVGRFFQSVDGSGKLTWHGEVIGRVSDDRYLVQLFDAVMGEPSVQRIVAISEMTPWLFYSDADEMKHSYEHGTASHMKTEATQEIRDY